jgi:putative NIF3 family GTP cyclohydrolase 1 type 2
MLTRILARKRKERIDLHVNRRHTPADASLRAVREALAHLFLQIDHVKSPWTVPL